jgi:hypothetical protein
VSALPNESNSEIGRDGFSCNRQLQKVEEKEEEEQSFQDFAFIKVFRQAI